MKIIFLTILVLLMANAHARSCQVYGISDSPQKLTCSFKNSKISLHCENGNYYLNSTRVASAFHYEVEEGPVPLVFKAPELQLTVLIQSKIEIQAELDKDGKTQSGTCY